MITWTAIKLFLGGAGNLIARHFQAVLITLLVLTSFYYMDAYHTERSDYQFHIEQDKFTAKMEAIKNGIIEKNSSKAVTLEIKKHKDTIGRLQVNETELKQKVSDLYAVKTNADFRLAAYSDRMLLKTGDLDTGTGSKIASDSTGTAECRRELNATDTRLSIVEEACAVTTADFNLCRGWINSVCSNHDCTGEVAQ